MTAEERDRAIINTMRWAIRGVFLVGFFFVAYIVVCAMTSAHDNRRIDQLEQRVEKLERGQR